MMRANGQYTFLHTTRRYSPEWALASSTTSLQVYANTEIIINILASGRISPMKSAFYVFTTCKKTNNKLCKYADRGVLDNVKVAISMQNSVGPALLYSQCSM